MHVTSCIAFKFAIEHHNENMPPVPLDERSFPLDENHCSIDNTGLRMQDCDRIAAQQYVAITNQHKPILRCHQGRECNDSKALPLQFSISKTAK